MERTTSTILRYSQPFSKSVHRLRILSGDNAHVGELVSYLCQGAAGTTSRHELCTSKEPTGQEYQTLF